MQVFVNRTPVSIFAGATAADAVRRYWADTGSTPVLPALFDAYGNRIAADSPMCEGRSIFTDKTLI